ncbi:HepT-like ribonuclease domain-containing protein [uncultured Methanospirillum sp.]|uniref:HepT-like ribonuclease domain-containing protein n=1 Tax=uncultured Methanospirillum sp. TaxID=262503 RepID=UPI0029C70D79|nr:HepT-like ribonuclease domain-containing protein [uncultured Methanospirillum sp.]
MKDDRYYLTLIGEYIEKINEYTQEGHDHFLQDEKTQDAVIRKLQILTETTQRLSDDIKSMEPAIPWQDIAGLRNILVHQYTDVNVSRIWLILRNDLPRLSEFVDCALDMLNKE